MENMSLKEIQSKLLLWEASDNPLAPLTSDQREAIFDLESLIIGAANDAEDVSTYKYLIYYHDIVPNRLKIRDIRICFIIHLKYITYHKWSLWYFYTGLPLFNEWDNVLFLNGQRDFSDEVVNSVFFHLIKVTKSIFLHHCPSK